MSRRQARENAFQLIYERITSGERNILTFELLLKKNRSEEAYLTAVFNGVDENLAFLSRIVTKFSKGFSVERIYKVDLSVLFLACYEILFLDDIPDRAAVNEALELVKIYSTEKSAVFINGILASVIANKEAILSGDEDDSTDSGDNGETAEPISEQNGENIIDESEAD